jgi:nitrate/nitrite-specific signal transduction histidine kinase
VVRRLVTGHHPVDVDAEVAVARATLQRVQTAIPGLEQSAHTLEVLAAENVRLRQDNIRLAKKLVDAQLPIESGMGPIAVDAKAIAARLRKAQEQLRELVDEQTRLRDRIVELEVLNSSMMSMYVAAQQLHSTLDPTEVVRVVEEILVNFVGASGYAIMLTQDEGAMRVVAARTATDYVLDDAVTPRGVVAEALLAQRLFVRPDGGQERILAVAPLSIGRTVSGAVLVLELFAQKQRLSETDVELLNLLSTHAASALMSAQLYQRSERKVKTLQSMLHLLQIGDVADVVQP